MSFYTSLIYHRPGTPPLVKSADLSNFLRRIHDTKLLDEGGGTTLKIKFGKSIDYNKKRTWHLKRLTSGLFSYQEIEWDLELSDATLLEMIERIASDQRTIYRAFVILGNPIQDVLRPLTRQNSPENEIDFLPFDLSLELGPIECGDLASAEPQHVGWIGLGLSGSGYLFPWTFPDVLQRLQASPEIQIITEVCRSFWPVIEPATKSLFTRIRESVVGKTTTNATVVPSDWAWGLNETG